jgi:hypothetical protein
LELALGAGLLIDAEGYMTTDPRLGRCCWKWEFTAELPNREDYILQRSQLTLNDIYAAAEWGEMQPQMSAPMAGEAGPSFGHGGHGGNAGVWQAGSKIHAAAREAMVPNIPLSMRGHPNQPTMSRKQRRAMEAKQRKAGRQNKAMVH